MQDYCSDDWPALAAGNGLGSFESIWALDIGWFEEPNRRRGGWSGVSRVEVEDPGGRHHAVFIKRQQNHNTFSPRHPVRGIPTFQREFRNLLLMHAIGVPTLEVLYYAERAVGDERRAILVSSELTGYASLADCLQYWQQHGYPEPAVWHDIIGRIAAVARRLHTHRIKHSGFLTKHIFIGEQDGQPDVRLIDLEKAKRCLTRERALQRDLDTLNRRSPAFSRADRLRFLLAYHETAHVNARVRKTWERMHVLQARKSSASTAAP